mgnify:CR=1 FL=1
MLGKIEQITKGHGFISIGTICQGIQSKPPIKTELSLLGASVAELATIYWH